MAQSTAATVDEYLDEIEPGHAAALRRVREIAVRLLPGREEAMRWGMAAYLNDGDPDFSFAAQKRHLALYVRPDVVERHAEELSGVDHGRSCLRFRTPEAIDFDLLERLLLETAGTPAP